MNLNLFAYNLRNNTLRFVNYGQGLTKEHRRTYEELKELMSRDSGYKNMRVFLHTTNPPLIPYIGNNFRMSLFAK